MINEEEARYEWTQAEDCLAAAKFLIGGGYYNSACNRLYYAVYHAAKTLVIARDTETKSHKGLFNQFSLYFVKTGVFYRDEHLVYRDIWTARESADYATFADFTEADARAYLPRVEAFLAKAKSLLDIPDA